MTVNNYIFKIIYVDGDRREYQHEGSYANMKQRYLWFKNNKEIIKISVFELCPKQINTSNW